MDATLAVIVPAYNEASTLGGVLRRVLQQPCVQQLIVVDDGSADGTFEVAQSFLGDPRVSVRRHASNRGKGAAIRTGVQAAAAPLVIIQDADLEYDALEYKAMITPLLHGRADVVYGVRGFAGQSAYSYWFVLGNRLLTTATNVLFNCYIQDMQSGFKAMRTELMRRLKLRSDRFDIEPEITARILRLGYRIHEVPITYYARVATRGRSSPGSMACGRSARYSNCGSPRGNGCSEWRILTMRGGSRLARMMRLPELPGDRAA